MEVQDYPNYLIYEDGSVYSNKRKKFLKPRDNGRGYYTVHLCKDGKHIHFLVHRLVAIHYIPNPHNYKEIDHIDRDKCNNHLYNLRWCDRQTNCQNTSFNKNNKLQIKNIQQKEKGYMFQKMINGKVHSKRFKTLEEAIQYKEEYLANFPL